MGCEKQNSAMTKYYNGVFFEFFVNNFVVSSSQDG